MAQPSGQCFLGGSGDMKFKDHSFLGDIQEWGWRVAIWNISFRFCAWLMRIQGARGLSTAFVDEKDIMFADEDNG